jgi:hypothetical protein
LSSVLDEVRTVQEHIVSRMAELRPLVAEYHELERIAQKLEVDTSQLPEIALAPAAAPKPAAKAPARKRSAKPKAKAKAKAKARAVAKPKAAAGTREKGAQRREQILDLIRTRPGITVPDLSGVLGVDPPPLYRVVRKLQADGIVTKNGKELRLV